jgi:hypothetical protein
MRRSGFGVLVVAGALVTSMVPSSAVGEQVTPAGVVLWNTLGSGWDVSHSIVGPAGGMTGGSFVAGRFGGAFRARHDQDYALSFPGEVVNARSGAVEFWARLVNLPDAIPGTGGGQPVFLRVGERRVSQRYKLFMTSNDGIGGRGLAAYAGAADEAGAGVAETASMDATYAEILGPNPWAWHHYALVWDADGIAGVGDGTEQAAVYVDGALSSTYWGQRGPFPAFTGARLWLLGIDQVARGATVIDNLIVWSCAVTDFTGRTTARPSFRTCA